MEKRIILILALAVIAAGCVNSPTEGGTPSPTETTQTTLAAANNPGPSSITTTTSVREEDANVPDTIPIILPENITDCLTLDNTTIRDACFYDRAGLLKDIGICDKIAGNNTQFMCKAHLEDNSDYCEQIDTISQKDWCYRMMAFKWNKMKYCNMVFYQKIKDECNLDYVKDKKPDPYQCFQIMSQDMRDDCIYFHIDLYNKTGAGIRPTLCGLINNKSLQVRCNETYLNQKFN